MTCILGTVAVASTHKRAQVRLALTFTPTLHLLPNSPTFLNHNITNQASILSKALCVGSFLEKAQWRNGKVAMTEQVAVLKNQLCLFWMRCSPICSHLYSDWVWIMLSVLYNLEYCMQNGPYWLSLSATYKRGSAQAYTDNPLRKQRPAGSSNEYKTPHKSQALAWHPASVLSCLRQWAHAWLWWEIWEGLERCLHPQFPLSGCIFLRDAGHLLGCTQSVNDLKK